MTAPPLDYAPPPSARRRWMRRLRRGWPVGLLLVIAGLGIGFGPGVWARWQVIKLQEVCMAAEMPTDRPVFERDPFPSQALMAAWPGEYRLNRWGCASRVDSRWSALAGVLGVPSWPHVAPGFPLETVFCHQRRTPDGRRRLVVIEGWWDITVIDPAAWPVGEGPRVVGRLRDGWDAASDEAFAAADGLPGPTRIMGGVPDLTDAARLTVQFLRNGVPGIWEYRLENDDRVTMHLLDTTGFIARAKAVKARATTQPAL